VLKLSFVRAADGSIELRHRRVVRGVRQGVCGILTLGGRGWEGIDVERAIEGRKCGVSGAVDERAREGIKCTLVLLAI